MITIRGSSSVIPQWYELGFADDDGGATFTTWFVCVSVIAVNAWIWWATW